MEGDTLGTIGMGVGIFGLLIAFMLYKKVDSIEIENKTVATITGRIQDGAMAFLMAEYRMLAVFIAVVSALLLFGGEENGLGFETMVAFIIGAFCSVAAWDSVACSPPPVLMDELPKAAANGGQAAALTTSYNGGAVMGLAVGGLGLFGISLMYFLTGPSDGDGFLTVGNIAGFGMGASSIALFARVGGGIYTKAADVGADLVGKVEAGIPEDDPRNPGVIADNVGDNVGDVAGMGADIFESFVGSIIVAMVIARRQLGNSRGRVSDDSNRPSSSWLRRFHNWSLFHYRDEEHGSRRRITKHHFHRCGIVYWRRISCSRLPGLGDQGNLRCGDWITRGYPDWFGN